MTLAGWMPIYAALGFVPTDEVRLSLVRPAAEEGGQ